MSINCRICNSSNLRNYFIHDTELTECLDCKIIYLASFPDSSVLDEIYKKKYKISEPDYFSTERRRIFRLPEQFRLLSFMQKYLPTGGRILDIGCDKGFFLDEARRLGYSCTGVEPSEAARKYCSKIGLETFPDIGLVNSKFDAAVLWHSLEHHPDPVHTLKAVYSLLNRDSYLFIRVPDFSCFWSRILKSRWIWMQPSVHYFYFKPDSMKKILELAGFEVLHIERRKPNDYLTGKMYKLGNGIFKKYYAWHPAFRERLARIYEDLTGVEIFAAARKKLPA